MQIFLSKAALRALSLVLVAGVLIGSIPLTASVIVVLSPTQPTFTLNICQPLQAIGAVPSNPIARPAAGSPVLILSEDGNVLAKSLQSLTDLIITPENPPPEPLA
jgi:hypothetical protein